MVSRYVSIVLAMSLVLAVVATSCAPSGGTGNGPSADKIHQWRAQQIHAAGSVYYEKGVELFQAVDTMSAGRLVITNNPPGALVPAAQELDAVKSGTIDAMNVPASFYTGQLGIVSNFWTGYPAGPGPSEMIMWYFEGGGKDLYDEMLEMSGYSSVKHVGMWILTSAELFCWANKPVRTLADFQGMKFRAGGMWGNMAATLGASVVTLPGGELYQSLERGVIDAFEFTTPGNDFSMGFTEIAKYVVGPGIHSPTSMCELNVNRDRWEELPDDLKAILSEAVRSALYKNWAEADQADVEGWQKIVDSGIEVITLSQEVQDEIIRVSDAFMAEKAAADPFFAKVWQSQQDYLKAYRHMKSVVQPSIGR